MTFTRLASALRWQLLQIIRFVGLIPVAALLASCGGGSSGSSPPPVSQTKTYSATSGIAQKGPLIKGSAVTAQELNSALSPTGKQYSYQISSDLGTFTPTSAFGSQYIGLDAAGYYFDEIQNAVSSGTVTLESYSDLSVDTVVNVNLLTTLAYQRIYNLVVNSNMTFAAARARAESEVLTALNIPSASYGAFGTLDLSGSSDGDHILAAISSEFVYGNQAGPLSVLINNFQNDLGTHGTITDATTLAELAAAAKALNPATIAANLNQRYASVGVTLTASDISDWIDQDGDGVVGKFKFQVPDATPSTAFTLPTFVVTQVAGTPVSVTAGQLSVNGTPTTGSVTVNSGDTVTVSPGPGAFPNGVLNVYLLSAGAKVARVAFVSGLLSISVTPASPTLAKGLTQQFAAAGTFSDTSTADLTASVTWRSSTPTVATVSAGGLAQGVAVGSTTLTATSGSVSGNVTLTVTAPALESLAITPTSPASGVGLTRQLTATATYSDGTTADVTGLATWTSSVPTVATIAAQTGQATGVSLGTTQISATVGDVSQSVTLSIVSNVWSPAASLSLPRYGHTATLLPNGTVLVAGGRSTSNSIAALAQIYDPVKDVWSPAANMVNARAYHTATLLSNGKVLVVGGMTTVPTNSAEIYDPVANTWTAAAYLYTARLYHTATLLPDGTVLVAGGTTLPVTATIGTVGTAEIYDPNTNNWTVTTMPAPVTTHTATLLANGTVLLAGGTTTDSTMSNVLMASAGMVYGPSTNTWTTTGNFVNPRYYHSATLLPNGQVLMAGGVALNVAFSQVGPSTEVYDPIANNWSAAGTLLNARDLHTATMLSSGTILLAGGTTNSAEMYDPTTNTSSAAASLINPRQFHTATLLPNGVVLVVGGIDISNGNALSSAELYW